MLLLVVGCGIYSHDPLYEGVKSRLRLLGVLFSGHTPLEIKDFDPLIEGVFRADNIRLYYTPLTNIILLYFYLTILVKLWDTPL